MKGQNYCRLPIRFLEHTSLYLHHPSWTGSTHEYLGVSPRIPAGMVAFRMAPLRGAGGMAGRRPLGALVLVGFCPFPRCRGALERVLVAFCMVLAAVRLSLGSLGALGGVGIYCLLSCYSIAMLLVQGTLLFCRSHFFVVGTCLATPYLEGGLRCGCWSSSGQEGRDIPGYCSMLYGFGHAVVQMYDAVRQFSMFKRQCFDRPCVCACACRYMCTCRSHLCSGSARPRPKLWQKVRWRSRRPPVTFVAVFLLAATGGASRCAAVPASSPAAAGGAGALRRAVDVIC